MDYQNLHSSGDSESTRPSFNFLQRSYTMEVRSYNDENNDPPNSRAIPYDALNVGLGGIGKVKRVRFVPHFVILSRVHFGKSGNLGYEAVVHHASLSIETNASSTPSSPSSLGSISDDAPLDL
ncbi:hypothetical protein KSP40_PGU018752 [Platanthera guangdongensis]|uniref:Uncharacterized protein n=1 Tax=Platanthera guangdongensis TaxID=2320717 RepID=A0ABR2MHL1_9ASPA